MKKEILKQILNKSKFYERIIIKTFPNLFIKAYNIGRITCFNNLQGADLEKISNLQKSSNLKKG